MIGGGGMPSVLKYCTSGGSLLTLADLGVPGLLPKSLDGALTALGDLSTLGRLRRARMIGLGLGIIVVVVAVGE